MQLSLCGHWGSCSSAFSWINHKVCRGTTQEASPAQPACAASARHMHTHGPRPCYFSEKHREWTEGGEEAKLQRHKKIRQRSLHSVKENSYMYNIQYRKLTGTRLIVKPKSNRYKYSKVQINRQEGKTWIRGQFRKRLKLKHTHPHNTEPEYEKDVNNIC